MCDQCSLIVTTRKSAMYLHELAKCDCVIYIGGVKRVVKRRVPDEWEEEGHDDDFDANVEQLCAEVEAREQRPDPISTVHIH